MPPGATPPTSSRPGMKVTQIDVPLEGIHPFQFDLYRISQSDHVALVDPPERKLGFTEHVVIVPKFRDVDESIHKNSVQTNMKPLIPH